MLKNFFKWIVIESFVLKLQGIELLPNLFLIVIICTFKFSTSLQNSLKTEKFLLTLTTKNKYKIAIIIYFYIIHIGKEPTLPHTVLKSVKLPGFAMSSIVRYSF